MSKVSFTLSVAIVFITLILVIVILALSGSITGNVVSIDEIRTLPGGDTFEENFPSANPVVAYTFTYDGGRTNVWNEDGELYIFNIPRQVWFNRSGTPGVSGDRFDSVNSWWVDSKSGKEGALPRGTAPVIGYVHPFDGGRINLWNSTGGLFIYNFERGVWFDRTRAVVNLDPLPVGVAPDEGYYDEDLDRVVLVFGRNTYHLDGKNNVECVEGPCGDITPPEYPDLPPPSPNEIEFEVSEGTELILKDAKAGAMPSIFDIYWVREDYIECLTQCADRSCSVDSDCDNRVPHTVDSCVGGLCIFSPIGAQGCSVDSDCDDGNDYTIDNCTLELCYHQDRECWFQSGVCGAGNSCRDGFCISRTCTPYWSEWSEWSACIGGQQERTRTNDFVVDSSIQGALDVVDSLVVNSTLVEGTLNLDGTRVLESSISMRSFDEVNLERSFVSESDFNVKRLRLTNVRVVNSEIMITGDTITHIFDPLFGGPSPVFIRIPAYDLVIEGANIVDSTIENSNVSGSNIINSTIINSTVYLSDVSNAVIINSYVDFDSLDGVVLEDTYLPNFLGPFPDLPDIEDPNICPESQTETRTCYTSSPTCANPQRLCPGGKSYCTIENPCKPGGGDCDRDESCMGNSVCTGDPNRFGFGGFLSIARDFCECPALTYWDDALGECVYDSGLSSLEGVTTGEQILLFKVEDINDVDADYLRYDSLIGSFRYLSQAIDSVTQSGLDYAHAAAVIKFKNESGDNYAQLDSVGAVLDEGSGEYSIDLITYVGVNPILEGAVGIIPVNTSISLENSKPFLIVKAYYKPRAQGFPPRVVSDPPSDLGDFIDNYLGDVQWSLNWCNEINLCTVGEGRCSKDSECLSGYCADDSGERYGGLAFLDVCECPPGTVWNEVVRRCDSLFEQTSTYDEDIILARPVNMGAETFVFERFDYSSDGWEAFSPVVGIGDRVEVAEMSFDVISYDSGSDILEISSANIESDGTVLLEITESTETATNELFFVGRGSS